MSLVMYGKPALSPAQLTEIEARLSLPVHAHDEGPSRAWRGYDPASLFAFFDDGSGRLIALVECAPGVTAKPGWWIDHEFRGQGYGREVVDLLATRLKANGVTHVGWLLIASHKEEYDRQSTRMAQRLRRLIETPAT